MSLDFSHADVFHLFVEFENRELFKTKLDELFDEYNFDGIVLDTPLISYF